MSTYYTQVRRRVPIVSLVILALNILGFVYELVVGENAAIYRFAMYQGALQDGGWYRLITSAFLHFGLMHLGSNMICLTMFGFDLEICPYLPGKYNWFRATNQLHRRAGDPRRGKRRNLGLDDRHCRL